MYGMQLRRRAQQATHSLALLAGRRAWRGPLRGDWGEGRWGAQLDNTSLISRIYTPMYFSPEQTHQGMEVRCTAPAVTGYCIA